MAHLSHGVIFIWAAADAEAQGAHHEEIQPAHLILGVCKAVDLPLDVAIGVNLDDAGNIVDELRQGIADLKRVFADLQFDSTTFRRKLRVRLGEGTRADAVAGQLHRSRPARDVFKRAENLAGGTSDVKPLHLLLALLEIENSPWAEVFVDMNVDPSKLAEAARQVAGLGEAAAGEGKGGVPPGGKAEKSSILKKFGRDLTQQAQEGKLDPIIGRRNEMRTLAQILMQKRKSNAILVGEAGVGKTGIVEGLAQRIVGEHPPRGLEGRRIVEVSMSSLVAGTKHRGEFEERMQGLIKEVQADRDVILFIDEIHTLMGAGGEGSGDAANILKPALARGDFSCIGATTVAEYRKYIEKDPALERRFQVVWVNEPTADEAIEILKGVKPTLENHHGTVITDAAISAAVELSVRYLPDLHLPDKAIDLIDQACAAARMATFSVGPGVSGPYQPQAIGRAEIARVVAVRCRVPLDQLNEDDAARFLRMEEAIRKRVIGQDEAVRVVCDAIRTARSGLGNPRRPTGVFLFVGSTGTGKTELAKALAEFLFGDESKLIRIDMSEYMEQHSVSKLIGSPPGYVGHDEEGQLTGPVRSNPYSVVLLDEIEKAHPRVMDLFLQVFDEGQLTDSRGRKASFRDSVIILTSNLGAGSVAAIGDERPFGFALPAKSDEHVSEAGRLAVRAQIERAVRSALRPELVNRMGRLVFFDPLDADAIRRIIDKILDGIRQRLQSRRIELHVTPPVYDALMRTGFDPQSGAREMERTVDRLIVQPIGKGLLEGRFRDGDFITISAGKDGIEFENV
jgi:ATP-dependent Clp protease ATP-binding subunit ClpC